MADSTDSTGVAFVGNPSEAQEHVLNLGNIASFLEEPFFDGPKEFSDEIVAAAKFIERLFAREQPADAQIGMLLVRAQPFFHDEAVIVGDELGLIMLRNAINAALERGHARTGNVEPGDGECYYACVLKATQTEIEGMRLSYTDPAACYTPSEDDVDPLLAYIRVAHPDALSGDSGGS